MKIDNFKLTFLLVFALLIGCSKEDENKPDPTIFGTWQLTAQKFGNLDGEGQWSSVENGYIYDFSQEGTLLTDRFSCSGTYALSSDSHISIDFECVDMEESYDFAFKNAFLILSPNPITCDEGCSFKFKKIENN